MKSILYINQDKLQTNHFIVQMRTRFNVITSESTLKSFEIIEDPKNEIVAVFCSENISGMKAAKFCETIRMNSENQTKVFILCSDRSKFENKVALLKSGVDDVIPFDFQLKNISRRLDFCLEYRSNKLEANKNLLISDDARPISVLKRSFDIMVALTALLILSPVFILVIVALKLESSGPVFYASKRVGTGYKIFDFYKFRSMSVNADQNLNSIKSKNQYSTNEPEIKLTDKCEVCVEKGSPCSPILFVDGGEMCETRYKKLQRIEKAGTFIKIANDPRITKVGQFIRNTSIDELPQLVNVLKGEMSIVGNRPLPLYEAELLTSDMWSQRFNAPAGITGLWQVEKRGAGSMSENERKQLDNTYAKNHSFLNDLRLIIKTVPALLQSENV